MTKKLLILQKKYLGNCGDMTEEEYEEKYKEMFKDFEVDEKKDFKYWKEFPVYERQSELKDVSEYAMGFTIEKIDDYYCDENFDYKHNSCEKCGLEYMGGFTIYGKVYNSGLSKDGQSIDYDAQIKMEKYNSCLAICNCSVDDDDNFSSYKSKNGNKNIVDINSNCSWRNIDYVSENIPWYEFRSSPTGELVKKYNIWFTRNCCLFDFRYVKLENTNLLDLQKKDIKYWENTCCGLFD